jgi:hypothetical protein
MPIDLLAGQQPEGRDLLAGLPDPDRNVLSFRKEPESSMWQKIGDWFPGDVKVQSAKAANALVYAEMFNIRPDMAYTYHDEISQQIQDKFANEKIVTGRQGIVGAFKSGRESSIAGLMANQKVSQPFESIDQLERWVQGMTGMIYDLPFFLTGYALGGGTPITGMAGGFGFTAGLRKTLIDKYSKGEVTSLTEFGERLKNAVEETVKGQLVGAATGAAGRFSPARLKLASELATMTTAGKLIEGEIPTIRDFIDNAGMMAVMHYGIKGYEGAKGRIFDMKSTQQKLMDSFVDSGAHPRKIAEAMAIKSPSELQGEIQEIIDKTNTEIKASVPPEPVEPLAAKPESKPPELAGKGATTSIKNATVDAEREARGELPIETPLYERSKTWREDVEAKVNSGEMNPRDMARKVSNLVEMGEKVPTLSDDWNHALLYDKGRLQNEFNDVETRINETRVKGEDVSELEIQQKAVLEDLRANELTTKAIGTEQSRALSSRKDEMDLSYAGMLLRAINDGIEPTPEVKTKLKKFSKDIASVDKKGTAQVEAAIKKTVDKTVEILKTEERISKKREQRTYKAEELDAEFDALVRRFNKEIGGQLNVGFDPTAIKTIVELARNRIRKGLLTAEEVVDSIHLAFQKAGLEYSKREIGQALSQYGVTKEMSKEDIDVKLREVKAQERLLLALEDAQKGLSPEHTGLRRDPQSDRVRDLTRQVNEAMRDSGIKQPVEPGKQWKTSLDAVKTRLRNHINDLKTAVKTKTEILKTKGVEYDTEAKILKFHNEKIQEIYDKAFEKPDPGISPEKQAAKALKEINREYVALDKAISEYIRKTETQDISTKKRKEPSATKTEDIALMRGVKEQAKKAFEEMKKELTPRKSPDEIRRQAFRTRLTNEIAELKRRKAEKDYSPKEKKPPVELQEAELEIQFKRDQIKREYMKQHFEWALANRTFGVKVTDGLIESVNLVKALKSSYDVSAVGRQGWLSFLAHPVSGAKDVADMFRSLRSAEAEFRIHQEIMKDKLYPLMKKAGLEITETEGIKANLEEMFQSRWANAIPGVPASNRAFSTYLNLRRVALFKEVYNSILSSKGVVLEAEARQVADYANQSTGRGNIRGYEQALTGLGVLMWAPKLVLSRFQMAAGVSMWKGTSASRIAIAKEYGRMLRTLGIIYAVSSLFDEVTIEDSTISSDWGKIKIGNRRIDILAGMVQNTVLMSRIWNEETKTAGGRVIPLTGNIPYGGKTIWTVMSDWGRTKLTPVLSEAINFKQGKDVVGNKVEMWDIPQRLLMPLSFGDIYDAMKEDGVPAGAILSTLATFGIGVQIYDPKQRNRQ